MGENFSKILSDSYDKNIENANIIIGTCEYIVMPDILTNFEIDSIVCCLLGNQNEYLNIFMNELGKRHKKYYTVDSMEINDNFLHYPLEDNRDYKIPLFSKDVNIIYVIDWIHKKRCAGKNILVHCDAGLTRSPTVVCAYLMKYGLDLKIPKKMSFDDAYNHIIKYRNDNRRKKYVDIGMFMYDLKLLEQKL